MNFGVGILYNKRCWISTDFTKIGTVRVILDIRTEKRFYPAFHVPWPIWVEFSNRELHLMLMSNHEFLQNRSIESHNLTYGRNRNFTNMVYISVWFSRSSAWEMSTKMYWVILSFVKIGALKAVIYLSAWEIFIRIFWIFFGSDLSAIR